MKTTIFIICTGILFLYGCQKGNQTLPDNLVGNNWILIKVVHTDTNIEESVPSNLANMNIEFNDSYRLHGLGACNSIDGDYSILHDDSLKVDNLVTTKKYCGNEINMFWEENFCNSLKNATNFKIAGNRLIIKSTSKMTLVFKAN
jgi:heat shock protein HslJ